MKNKKTYKYNDKKYKFNHQKFSNLLDELASSKNKKRTSASFLSKRKIFRRSDAVAI